MDLLRFGRLLALGILLLMMSCIVAASGDAESAAPSPDAAMWTDLDGQVWTPDARAGRVVVLDFWATWCAPCLAELPHLRALDARHGDDDLLILGIALDAIDRPRLRAFLSRHGVTWPQIHAPTGASSPLARRFGVGAVPVTVVIDRKGRIVARDLRGEALAAVVEALSR
ncbi:MAG: TlpA disulfide reductase family protein [Acidobacteriota bacterium]